jgi:hypothetical protein
MLYLVTGYKTEHREGDPAVLYCGSSAEAAEAAVTHAPADFLRVERAMVIDSYKVRSGVVAGVSPAAACAPAVEEAPPAAEPAPEPSRRRR